MPRKRGQQPRRAAAASGTRAARARVLASLAGAYLVEVVLLLLGVLGAVLLLGLPAADATTTLPRPPAPGKSAFTARDHYVGRRALASAPRSCG